jgi:hypothetical protein
MGGDVMGTYTKVTSWDGEVVGASQKVTYGTDGTMENAIC